MGPGSGAPLDAHIKFLLDACIFSRLGGSAARSYEGRQIRKSALNCRAVDSVNNLLRSKRVNHIGDARRKIAVLLVKAHGRRHRIRRDLNTNGNDGILLPVSRRRIKFRFDAIGRAHKARQLQGVKIRDSRFFHFLLEAPDFDARAADLLRINGEIAAIRSNDKLKSFAFAPNGTLHNTTLAPSKLRFYYNYFPQGFMRTTLHHSYAQAIPACGKSPSYAAARYVPLRDAESQRSP